jgi:hypothetical protein
MAVEIIRRRVCDICSGENGVVRVRLTRLNDGDSTKTVTVDLCKTHEEPIAEAFKAKTGTRKQHRVVSKKTVTARRR